MSYWLAALRRYTLRRSVTALALFGACMSVQANPLLMVMGDSISEGVQAANAAWQTQIYAYGRWIAHQMGTELTLPIIQSGPLGTVGETFQRRRLRPYQLATNVAVSGSDLSDLLRDKADAERPADIDEEIDLVLYPSQLAQIEAVEAMKPRFLICWIGSNDALGTATEFSALDASQLTPLADFEADYALLVDRLGSLAARHGTKIVFVNIPDVTSIGFLIDGATAEAYLNFPVDLPQGSHTSVVALLLMALAGDDTLMDDPNFVLDNIEIAIIQARIAAFNAVIRAQAQRIGMPVFDVNQWYQDAQANPPEFFGYRPNSSLLGGIFSLDLVHPSNISHALLANELIQTMNAAFGTTLPTISPEVLSHVFLLDPSIDKDKDGRARGRPGVGLLESIAFLVGLTGDKDDLVAD
jgi:lysophospholipase L1-like esterase